MSECSSSVDHLKRVQLILNDHEEPEEPGLGCGADAQIGTGTTGGVTLSRCPQPKHGTPSVECPKLKFTSIVFRQPVAQA